jgi:hypothetical protein
LTWMQGTFVYFVFFVGKNMDVNVHDKLSSFTRRNKLK